jgi:hypothetical protein
MSRVIYSAETNTETKARVNAIIRENSNPRAPTSGKKRSIREIKITRANDIKAFFENNTSIRVIQFNLYSLICFKFNTIILEKSFISLTIAVDCPVVHTTAMETGWPGKKRI